MAKQFKGKQSAERVQENNKLPMKRTDLSLPWIWTHQEYGWEYSASANAWLPRLGDIIIKQGCNGIRPVPIGVAPHPAPAIAGAMQKGYTIIRANDPRLGEYKGYIYEYDTVCGTHYATQWDGARMLGNRVVFDFDQEGFDVFRLFLISSGIVNPMDPFVLEIMVSASENRINNLSRSAVANPPIQAKMELLIEKVEKMKASFESQFGEDEDEVPVTSNEQEQAIMIKPKKSRKSHD